MIKLAPFNKCPYCNKVYVSVKYHILSVHRAQYLQDLKHLKNNESLSETDRTLVNLFMEVQQTFKHREVRERHWKDRQ